MFSRKPSPNPQRTARLLRAYFACPLLCTALSAFAAIPDTWFVWPALEPLPGSALDASSLNTAPAGATGRVRVENGHFVTEKGGRLRFWGANLSAYQCFPTSREEARLIATRLARGGVNIVRLHHLDNQWGLGTGGSIWRADRPDHLELDAVQLDRLHLLIAELKAHGIYSNLNLKVSKTLAPADGFPASISQVPDFDKRIDMFQRRMIDLQKDYARRLLTTRNPYTGLSPIDDPAIAVIELNNENSLLGFWTRDLGRGTQRFAEPFRTELQTAWNAWLTRRYADDSALAKAWANGAGKLGAPLTPSSPAWQLNTQRGSAIALAKSAPLGEQQLTLTGTTGTDWHTQAGLGDLHLEDNTAYTVEFEASADKPRDATIVVGLSTDGSKDSPWRSMGLYETVRLDTTPKLHRLSFVTHSVAGEPARLCLNLGQTDGTLRITTFRISPGALNGGLLPAQSPRTHSVPIPQEATTVQWEDWLHFLADTERSWADEMRAYLRDDLHVTAPMVGSQIEYGGLTGANREQAMDFADSHSYWQHPDFPATGMWDPHNWTIRNTPQLAEYGDRYFGELGTLTLNRIAGKPFTVSEYDHPAPSEYVCEMYPVISTYASRQDWDGIYPFCVEEYGPKDKDGALVGFFDQHHHPAKWGFSSTAARIFRRALIPAAPPATLRLGDPLWAESPHADILWRRVLGKGRIDFLNNAFGVSDNPLPSGQLARLEPAQAGAATSAEPRPLTVTQTDASPVWSANAGPVAVLSGYLGGRTSQAGTLTVECAPFGKNFASITAVALDEQPLSESNRILVTLAARAENQDMGWNSLRTSVGKNWGHGPTIAERVPATLTLAVSAPLKIYALSPDGSRHHEVPTRYDRGHLRWQVSPTDHTLHYELTK